MNATAIPTALHAKRILIVEDDLIIAMEIQMVLESMGLTVLGPVDNGAAAIRLAHEGKPDLVLMDIKIKGKLNGIETVARLRQNGNPKIVYLSAFSTAEIMAQANTTGPYVFLSKPITEHELQHAIETAMAQG